MRWLIKRRLGLQHLGDYTVIKNIENLKIGRGVIVGDYVTIRARGGIELGDNVTISSYASILSTGKNRKTMERIIRPVIIGNNVWVCTKATIEPGVTIGENSIIGAHSFVREDVPPNSFVVGTPATIKERMRGDQ